ncbi:hypothetical protein ALMP_75570 [Streptomyces sp. A012304]|nr:hypothetical protein ALMP_75570 [Streptomyces sp. A012304]
MEHDADPFEDRLSAALRQAGGTFDTNRAALAAAGQARGRRLRLRRAAFVGGAAGLALVGVGGALVVSSGGSQGPSQTASVAASRTAAPASYSADDVIRTLEKLLPKGRVSGRQGRGSHEELPPSALVVYDDGKGAAAVSVGLDRVLSGAETGDGGFDPAGAAMRCPDAVPGAQSAFDSCRTEKLPDGSVLTVYQGYEYPDRRTDTKSWGAELVTSAGQRVSVQEWNSPAQKGQPVSRPEPPLSPAQLKKLASAPQWRAVIDAIPERAGKPAPAASDAGPPPAPSGKAIQQTLAGLLPKGLEVVARGGQDTEFAYVVVDDGKGESYVQINVQPDMSDVAGQLYGSGSETLPDGTRVATRQGPGEKGGQGVVMWTVDTMRQGGERVVVSAFNSGSQERAATRPEPALTIAQLREIALSPKWSAMF